MRKRGSGFGWIVVKLKGVGEPSGPSEGARGNPERFVVAEHPPVIGHNCGGAVCW